MRRKINLIIISVLSLLIGIVIYVNLVPYPKFSKSTIIKETRVFFDIQEGKKLATTTCFQCHYNYEQHALSGRQFGNPKRLGDYFSPNITQDKKTGIGSWTYKDLYVLLRTGIKKDGTVAFDMPKYPLLSEYDIQSLIAFLRSDDQMVKPIENNTPEPSYSIFVKLYKHFFLKPEPISKFLIEHPDTNDSFQFGKYLVNAKYSCFDCHSRNSITNNYSNPEKSLGYLRGGNRHANENREIIYAPSIINVSNAEHLGYNQQEFFELLTNGIKKNGEAVRNPMFPFSNLTRKESQAIFKYLNQCCND